MLIYPGITNQHAGQELSTIIVVFKQRVSMTKLILFCLACASLVLVGPGFGHRQSLRLPTYTTPNGSSFTIASSAIPVCDSLKWRYVYDPERLQIVEPCKVVTGVIVERNADPDGDEHMLLKLDKGQKDLLLKKNYSKKEGCLVVEVVCVNHITRKRAKGACTGYVNNVHLPQVGEHVRVSGSYVIDLHNNWSEIHPASSIEAIK
jgi:hypothetical protein